jgi:hypothetical protein
MGLDLWFREDVARILASSHETMTGLVRAVSSLDPEVSDAYQRGFVDALRAVAVAFGVAAPTESGRTRLAQDHRAIDAQVQGPSAADDVWGRWNGGNP